MDTPFFRQAWAASAIWINMMGQGMQFSYTTSLLPALQDPASPIKADLHTASWLSGAFGIAGLPGFLLSSFIMEVYGRRMAHLLPVIPGILGCLIVYFSQNISTIVLGRIMCGISGGATATLGAIVIGEYSDPVYRGVFLNFKTATVYLGGLLMHILSHYFTWKTISLITMIPQIFTLAIVLTWPESPSWLATRGEFNLSKKSFFWLRGKSEASCKELDELIKMQADRLSNTNKKKSYTDILTDFFKKFLRKDFVKPLFIVFASSILLEASGRHFFPAYALQIITELSNNKSHSIYYTMVIDIIITASAIFSSILIKIMNRRTLLFSTGFSALAVLMIACTYLSWFAEYTSASIRTWIVISIFVAYFILANLGCSPIPMALLGEVFPLAHRGAGSAVSGIFMSINVMIALQITPYLLYRLEVQGMFFVYGIIMGLALLMLYFLLPETKDKTLQEIETEFIECTDLKDIEEVLTPIVKK